MRKAYLSLSNNRLTTIGLTIFLAFLLMPGCVSVHETPIITENSRVPRSSAILVLGLEYVEDYNNVHWDDSKESGEDNPRIKTRSNQTVYQRASKLTSETIKPIHYLENITLSFKPDDESKEIQSIVRYSDTSSGYEPIAIHQFQAGAVSANAISFKYPKWRFSTETSEHINELVHYAQDYGHWDIAAGEIVYLGHITLYFKSKKHIFGFFNRIEANLNTKLVKVTLTDRFDQTRELLASEKPWFPVNEMKNLSTPGEWVFDDLELVDEIDLPDKSPDEPEKKTGDKDRKKQKSDDGDLFF